MNLYTIPAIGHIKTGIFDTLFNLANLFKEVRNYPLASNNGIFFQNKRVDNVQ